MSWSTKQLVAGGLRLMGLEGELLIVVEQLLAQAIDAALTGGDFDAGAYQIHNAAEQVQTQTGDAEDDDQRDRTREADALQQMRDEGRRGLAAENMVHQILKGPGHRDAKDCRPASAERSSPAHARTASRSETAAEIPWRRAAEPRDQETWSFLLRRPRLRRGVSSGVKGDSPSAAAEFSTASCTHPAR